jgi:hypothetical protein
MMPTRKEVLDALDALAKLPAFQSVAERLTTEYRRGAAELRPPELTTARNAADVYAIKLDTSTAAGFEPEGMRAVVRTLQGLDNGVPVVTWLFLSQQDLYVVFIVQMDQRPVACFRATRRPTPPGVPYAL